MKMLLKDGKANVLTFSYDDGTVQDKRLMEIFNRYGLKATFNINSGLYYPGDADRDFGRMTKTSSISLYKDSGHEVAVHGHKHLWPTKIRSVELLQEILKDRQCIEEDYGIIARGMAYAYGGYNQAVIDAISQCGIVYARTIKSTYTMDFPENWLELNPTCHHKDPRLMEIANRFVNEKHRQGLSRMLYVWGHSFEFDQQNNWDVIESFCQFVSGHAHIWYATNIEVYDYISAYNRLQVSLDESIITNPSATDVWVEVNEQVHCIKAGETCILK